MYAPVLVIFMALSYTALIFLKKVRSAVSLALEAALDALTLLLIRIFDAACLVHVVLFFVAAYAVTLSGGFVVLVFIAFAALVVYDIFKLSWEWEGPQCHCWACDATANECISACSVRHSLSQSMASCSTCLWFDFCWHHCFNLNLFSF